MFLMARLNIGSFTNSLIAFVTAIALAVLVGATPAYCAQAASSEANTMAQRGLAISPVPVNLKGRDKNLVGLGSYLVNAVADCGGCHTFPRYLNGGDPFHGTPEKAVARQLNTKHFLAGGYCFGPVMSTNLTPDLDDGDPADMTLMQFMTAMRTGSINRSTLLQAPMPWPTYHNMSDHDLKAIYEYLSAIPHADPCNDSCPPKYSNSADCPNPAVPQ